MCKSKYVIDFLGFSPGVRKKEFVRSSSLDSRLATSNLFSSRVCVYCSMGTVPVVYYLTKGVQIYNLFLTLHFLITSIRLSPHQKDKENFAFACYIFPNMCIYTFLHSQFVLKLSSFYFLHLELVS